MCKPRSLGAKFMNTAAIIFWSTVTIVTFAFILRDVRAGYFDYGKKKREREKDKAPLSSALEDPVPYLTFTQEECELIDLQQSLFVRKAAKLKLIVFHFTLFCRFTRQTRQQPGSSLWLSPEGFDRHPLLRRNRRHLPPDGSLYLAAPQSEEQKSGVPSNLKQEEVRIIRRDDGLALAWQVAFSMERVFTVLSLQNENYLEKLKRPLKPVTQIKLSEFLQRHAKP